MELEQALGVISRTVFLMTAMTLLSCMFFIVNLAIIWPLLKIARWILARIKVAWDESDEVILANKILTEKKGI